MEVPSDEIVAHINATREGSRHMRPKRERRLTGVATAIHKGRATHMGEIKISDENDKLVCISCCTVVIVDPRPTVAIH